MSQGIYIKLISHIQTDSERANAVSKTISAGLGSFIKSVYGESANETSWQSFSHQTDVKFDKTEATFYDVVSGSVYEKVDELLSEINTLQNGSYGMLLVDSDYGVMEYKCYGDAAFSGIPADDAAGFVWSTDDTLCLEKCFTPGELAELLDCAEEDTCDAAAEQPEKIVPEIIHEIYPDADDELFDSCEAEETEDGMIVRCLVAVHDHETEQLLAWKEAFENGNFSGWSMHLSETEEDGGCYNNVMICPDHNAVVSLKTSSGTVSSIQFKSLHGKAEQV